MYSYFKCIYLLWVICNTLCITADNVKKITECPAGKFNITPIGHLNLLFTWEPQDKPEFNSFHFDYKPDGDELWDRDFGRFLSEDGWYKITSSLTENTRYQIRVWNYGLNFKLWECFIVTKTNPKKNSFPTKPDFKVSMMNELKKFKGGEDGFSYQPRVRIEWLPCGKKKFCDADEIAGVDFSVKYKILNSTQEWHTRENYLPYKYIFGLLPGKEYEVVVTSVYGEYMTDSDAQIISIKPLCSPVQSVKIMTLPDSSVFISWKSPKQCQLEKDDWLGYTVFYHILDNSPIIFLNYSSEEKPFQENIYVTEFKNQQGVMYGQSKMLNFTLGTSYTFFILPRAQKNIFHGSEYRIDYIPQSYEANLRLAKPDFEYEFSSSRDASYCSVVLLWLPCGQTYDCKNMKPGSYFVVKYREGNGETREEVERRYDRMGSYIRIHSNKKYEFWVESVDQSDRVKSESKIIDTSKCAVEY